MRATSLILRIDTPCALAARTAAASPVDPTAAVLAHGVAIARFQRFCGALSPALGVAPCLHEAAVLFGRATRARAGVLLPDEISRIGADARFAIPYVDPKVSDGTDAEAATYDARLEQIGTEMLYLMGQVAARVTR